MSKNQNTSILNWSDDVVDIRIGLPGLVAEQHLAYRKTIIGWLGRLANRIDLSGLGSVEITVDYRSEIEKRNLDAMAANHVATSYVTCADLNGKPASAHVILDLVPHIGLLDGTADQHAVCLHSLAAAVGHATSSWLFDQRYGLYWEGGQYERWNGVARDCLIAFVTGHLTHGIGADMAEDYSKQQMAMAEEIKSAGVEWVRAEAKAGGHSDYVYSAWDMTGCYSNFFVSTARWLGIKAAKCEAIDRDFGCNIGPQGAEWPSILLATLLRIHRKWAKAENASPELTLLAEQLLGIATVDVAERYPPTQDYLAEVPTSECWPAMLVWPTTTAAI